MARRRVDAYERRRRYKRAAKGTRSSDEQRACRQKARFHNADEARRAAAHFGGQAEPYSCVFCGGVHLATKR